MATGICGSSVPEQLPVDSRQIKLHKYKILELKFHALLHCKWLCFWPRRCKWHGLPSLLPLIVVSDETLGAWELKEFKLSRELSLLCTPPPSACPPVRWCSSSRSEYQLSPNPLSLMLLSLRLGVSCRAFHRHKRTDFRVSQCVHNIHNSTMTPTPTPVNVGVTTCICVC